MAVLCRSVYGAFRLACIPLFLIEKRDYVVSRDKEEVEKILRPEFLSCGHRSQESLQVVDILEKELVRAELGLTGPFTRWKEKLQ